MTAARSTSRPSTLVAEVFAPAPLVLSLLVLVGWSGAGWSGALIGGLVALGWASVARTVL
ncbi:hypothetical protein [Kocuria sp. CPCC 205263]|uniref:hypothetical protein n=1 Tax=Kocuria sp. CPCC 205263 TaxID=3073555 RepID=UPI0034D64E14